MNVDGQPYRSIWEDERGRVCVIDQSQLPHRFRVVELPDHHACAHAIMTMMVRGAPLIGVTAAYGLALAVEADSSGAILAQAYDLLLGTRPTAINLRWGLDRVRDAVRETADSRTGQSRADVARSEARAIAELDVSRNRAIGYHGAKIIEGIWREKKRIVQVLTHCNAGWLAAVDWGTALAPVYRAHALGIPVHVWVDETRPRNQGAMLTAWELGKHGIAHTVIADNEGGHLMQHREVDICIVGADRVTSRGDVANKIGTYLKALSAQDTGVPFYVAAPSSTIDWTISDGIAEIPIERRSADEVTHVWGLDEDGVIRSVRVAPEGSAARNDAFDVTPARLISGIVTEIGCVNANAGAMRTLRLDLAEESS